MFGINTRYSKIKTSKYSIYAEKDLLIEQLCTLAYDVVCSEIADVQILIDQMMTSVLIKLLMFVGRRKIKRLEERLNKIFFNPFPLYPLRG